MNDIKIEVIDDTALDAFDRLLDPKARRRIVYNAKRAAAQPIRKQAAINAPVGSPRIWRQMRFPGGGLKAWLKRAKTGIKVTRNKNVYILAGVRRKSADIDPMDAFYAYWVEHGHKMPRGIRNAKANPFMRKAAKSKASESKSAFNKKFSEGVKKELAKARNRRRR